MGPWVALSCVYVELMRGVTGCAGGGDCLFPTGAGHERCPLLSATEGPQRVGRPGSTHPPLGPCYPSGALLVPLLVPLCATPSLDAACVGRGQRIEPLLGRRSHFDLQLTADQADRAGSRLLRYGTRHSRNGNSVGAGGAGVGAGGTGGARGYGDEPRWRRAPECDEARWRRVLE